MPQRLLEIKLRKHHPLQTACIVSRLTGWNAFLIFLSWTIKHSPTWVMPILMGAMIDVVAKSAPDAMTQLLVLGAITLGVIIQNPFTHTFYYLRLSALMRVMERDLRSALVRRLQHLSISFHHETQAGRLQTKVLRDVENIENFARFGTEQLMSIIISTAVVVCYAIIVAPLVLPFLFLGLPFAVGFTWLFRSRLREGNAGFRKEIEAVSARVNEMIVLLPVTRAHGAERQEIEDVEERLGHLKDRAMELDTTNAIFQSLNWSSFQIIMQCCTFAVMWLCLRGHLTIGQITVFTSLGWQLLNVGQQALGMMPTIARGAESMRSMAEILECPDLERNEGRSKVDRIEGRVEFDHVHFQYPNTVRPAIDDVSFTIAPGECVAFVGASGSGKSTAMNLLIGFHRPQTGRILLDGVDMETIDMRTWRRHIAVVSQNVVLFSGSLRENIGYGLDDVDERKLQQAIEAANLTEIIEDLPAGLETMVGENGVKLSGGQRQRVAIARALVRDPRLIILDEATSALDVISEKQVQQAIDRLVHGRTTAIVAHRLSTIRNASRIYVLGDGHILESGSQAELLAKGGAFADLKALQH